VSALKEPKLKRKYTGEKRVFIAGGIDALVLATGGTAFACFTRSGLGALLARTGPVPSLSPAATA
jgi:hypothetical protein